MYSDSQLNITTQVLEYDRGGGGRAFSFSSNAPTVSAPDDFKEKRFRRGDVNPSDGTIFWCYQGTKQIWLTEPQFAAMRVKARAADAKYRRGDSYVKSVDRRRAKEKRYRQSIKGREREKRKQRKRWANPEWRKKRYAKRRNRYKNDAAFATRLRVGTRIRAAIKNAGGRKRERTDRLVGCSFDFLRQHIERQFTGKMSWDNPSSFEIDHIVPMSAFDLTDPAQVRVACNWQNLRPISRNKNRTKGAKLTEPQLPLPLTVHSTTTYSL